MNKIFRIIFIITILIITGILFFWEDNKDISLRGEIEVEEKEVSLTINKGEGEKLSYNKEIIGETTVFDLLIESDVNVEYEEYDIGVFVTAIDGIENNPKDNSNWMYYVNGEQPGVGADQKKVFPGDNVEWKYEKVQW
jgi:hypothetical protein